MKNTYAAPAVVARGDVVGSTLMIKSLSFEEVGTTKRPAGGNNLSFGL